MIRRSSISTSANFKAALERCSRGGSVHARGRADHRRNERPNEFYPNEEAYLYAIADALKQEYQAIVDAGFLVQLDDPWITAHWDRMIPEHRCEGIPEILRNPH